MLPKVVKESSYLVSVRWLSFRVPFFFRVSISGSFSGCDYISACVQTYMFRPPISSLFYDILCSYPSPFPSDTRRLGTQPQPPTNPPPPPTLFIHILSQYIPPFSSSFLHLRYVYIPSLPRFYFSIPEIAF